MAERRPAPWRRPARWRRAGLGAALGLLCWVAALALGLPRVVGLNGPVGYGVGVAAGALLGGVAPAALHGVALALALLYAVVAATPLARVLIPQVVRADALPAAPAVDAVAVMSSGVNTAGRMRDEGLDRLVAGAGWARALGRPLVISHVRLPGRPRAASSAADQREVTTLASVGRVVAVDSVRVTRDEAVHMAAVARREGWRRVLLVTSPSHTRRACAAFERAGLAVVCVPAPARTYALDGPYPLDGPAERVAAFRDWVYEAVGWAVYRARGWV